MSAVVVQNVYKKFGKPSDPFWKRFLSTKSANNGHNGNGNSHKNGNGHNPDGIEAVKLAQLDGMDGKRNGNGNHQEHKNGKETSKPAVIAVNYVSFTIEKGEIFGVLGPNGGGKSTLIRLISTLLLPDEGKITVFGHDVVKQPMQVQKMINRVSVEASFFKKLSVV